MKNLEQMRENAKIETERSEEAAWERAVSFVESFKKSDVFSDWVKLQPVDRMIQADQEGNIEDVDAYFESIE